MTICEPQQFGTEVVFRVGNLAEHERDLHDRTSTSSSTVSDARVGGTSARHGCFDTGSNAVIVSSFAGR